MGDSYKVDGKFWVSSYNFKPEVLAASKAPQTIEIHDATLRDGEQTPGVVFRKEQDIDDLLAGIMKESKPDSIGLVDTMGCATPAAIGYLTRKYIALTGLPVEVHTHNDFGMAVAAELAGVEAGASVVHSCVNGLGERTGNASLEELILALELLYDKRTGCDIAGLGVLSTLVEEISGIKLARNKPVVGTENYTRESGIGVNLVMEQPLAMFATHPALFGRTGKIVLGKKSGKPSVVYKLAELGLGDLVDAQTSTVLAEVKRLGNDKRGLVTDDEFKVIVQQVREG